MQSDAIRFYFSFRSPYTWLAVHRIGAALSELPVTLDWIPVFPPQNPEDFPNNPTNNPAKVAYIVKDITRIAEAYGLPLKWPPQIDTDWLRPHAAFLYAQARGDGERFAKEVFAARFSRGLDVGTDETLSEVAEACGLDPSDVLAAADDPKLHERMNEGIRKALRDDGLFGVPTYIYRGEPFWGNDRLEWLVRAIRRDAGGVEGAIEESKEALEWARAQGIDTPESDAS